MLALQDSKEKSLTFSGGAQASRQKFDTCGVEREFESPLDELFFCGRKMNLIKAEKCLKKYAQHALVTNVQILSNYNVKNFVKICSTQNSRIFLDRVGFPCLCRNEPEKVGNSVQMSNVPCLFKYSSRMRRKSSPSTLCIVLLILLWYRS